jgi:type I restriction enzyme S subunit
MHKTKNTESLKPGWRRVKFGDVVRLSKERCANPLAEGVERYVGLEHLEPGDLRIRNWGNVADGVTFTSAFKPGQVLFGKRRAYQRKVAVANFSGVCSGDIYVMDTKDALVLLPELLPFICQTDAFFDHAVSTSAGSLSPRTNWTSLADFEFFLPTTSDQKGLLQLLTSIRESLEELDGLQLSVNQLKHSYRTSLLSAKTSRWEQLSLAEVAESHYGIVDGPFGSNLKTEHYKTSGIPVIQSGFVTTESFLPTSYVYVDDAKFEEQKRSAVRAGDIVMAKIGENCGACAIMPTGHQTGLLAGNALKITVDKNICLTDWVCNSLQALRKAGGLRTVIKTTAQPAMSLAELRKVKIFVPPLKEQERICAEINEIDQAMREVISRKANLSYVLKIVFRELTGCK